MFNLDENQMAQMKAKTFKGINAVLAKRSKKANCERGVFVILPDRENVGGFPVVSFVGVNSGAYATEMLWETWRDVIMEANEAGMDFAERMAAKGALAFLSDSQKSKIYEAIDESGKEANAAMVENTDEGQVIVCLSSGPEKVSFYVAEVNPEGYPGKFVGKELEII